MVDYDYEAASVIVGDVSVTVGGADRVDDLREISFALTREQVFEDPVFPTPLADLTPEEMWKHRREAYTSLLQRTAAGVFLARRERALVGFAVGHIEPDPFGLGAGVGIIDVIGVTPPRRTGVAVALVASLVKAAQVMRVEHWYATCLAGNDIARSLFQVAGGKERFATYIGEVADTAAFVALAKQPAAQLP